MSGRRQRAKTARAIASEEQQLSVKRKSITKPKYVEDASRRSDTPTSARSRVSTPNSSRQPSRSPTPPRSATGKRRSSVASSAKATRSAGRPKRGITSSGSNTPIGRGSRSSSVASAYNHTRKAATAIIPKIKTKLGRGYNPSLVNYKDSEYHYGSDFEDEGEDDHEDPASEHSSDEDEDDVDSDDLKVESDIELDLDAPVPPLDSRSSTPVPFWLRTGDEVPPQLELPPSSDDLLITSDIVLKACSTYEVLRHYRLLLRLSPFRFEDFCAALAAEEQSNLLSEIHISLLKAIIRAEEKDNTTFAPLDQKDSVNCLLFFMDSISWPDCLRAFLLADPVAHAEPIQIMSEHKEYPITAPPTSNWVQCRIDMLSFLTDQFLTTNAVREDIVTEGVQPLEDHCRLCHRLGDMLVCDQCSGVFHIACLDPPVLDIPEDEWQCRVCQANEVQGVTDCASENERGNIRNEALGTDRAGNKYWFICRRIFVEAQDGSVAYYSTPKQLEELIYSLDAELYESDLCETIEDNRHEIERQMRITENLTNNKKANFRKSYLELENASIEKLQQEREARKQAEEEVKRLEVEETARKMREVEEAKKKVEEEARQLEEEKKRKLREERLRKREESRGDSFPNSDDLLNDFECEIKSEEMETDTPPSSNEVKKEEQTDQVTVKEEDDTKVSDEVLPMETDSKEELKEEVKEAENSVETSAAKPAPPASPVKSAASSRPEVEAAAGDLRLTRKTIQQINTGTLFFKLGQEATYKTYVNQFTTNISALSKVQATEERVKRTHLSHKFSLTDASTFKWIGTLHGARAQVLSTLRATMLQLENGIPSIFMHTNWNLLRKPWIGAVGTSVTPRDFARALTVLQCCLKPCLLLNVWYDSLGHTALKKFTGQMKEDKKKMEKRERREKEEEDEKLRPYMGFVKYTLGLKHQVAKQRGEEYRAHGQFGWLWLSSTRNYCPSNAMKLGLRAGPHRLAVKYTDIRDKSFKIVLMEPNAFEYLLKKQDEIDLRKAMGLTEEEIAAADEAANKDETGKNKERSKLEAALKNARLARQVPDPELFKDVVDVEDGISKNTRSLYPKVGAKTKYLHDFLGRRMQLKSLEERRFELNKPVSTETNNAPPVATAAENEIAAKNAAKIEELNKFVEDSKKSLWSVLTKLKDIPPTEPTNNVGNDSLKRPAEMSCYSSMCAKGVPGYTCYSLMCPNYSTSILPTPPAPVANPALQEALALYTSLCQQASAGHGIKIESKEFLTIQQATNELQNLVKVLMQKKEEETKNLQTVVNGNDVTKSGDGHGTKSAVAPSALVSEETKKREALEGRIYSSSDTSGKLYLKRIQSVGDPKGKSKEIRYPLAPSFHSKSRDKKNILILAKYDVKRMARKAGMVTAEGFNYNAKANYQVWPYPCPRPTFKCCWLYRTACLESLQSVALQLRILWACLKWDDMHTKPPMVDGKNQVTSDSAIVTTEILKCRTTGRFLERTEYLQRKITIPLDVPKTIKEVMPVRAGLRKRKRAESPQQMEPKVTEEWTDEEKLELWEVRAYKERLEREKAVSLTRSRTGTCIKEPQRLDPGDNKNRRSEGDMKTKMEETLRLQREVLQKKTTASASVVRTTVSTPAAATPPPTVIRRIQNPDGTVSLVRTVPRTMVGGTTTTTTTPITSGGASAPKRIFVTKDGKVITGQFQQQSVLQQQLIKPTAAQTPVNTVSPAPTTTVATPPIQSPAPAPGSQQKVQIVRSTDGKIQVRGLLPGQQLIQMPDGKLQIVTQPLMKQNTGSPTVASPNVASPGQIQGQNNVVIQPNAIPGQIRPQQQQQQQQLAPVTTQQQHILGSPVKPGTIMTPNAGVNTPPNQILATQLAPGSQIPPGTTVFVSGGKTYCIPKASSTLAGGAQLPQHPVTNLAPVVPTNLTQTIQPSLTPSTVTAASPLLTATTQTSTSTSTTPTTAVQQPKQMVEVKTLGQNVVTFKGTQMIVQGPDIAQAQNIARQLSTGAARLAMLHGKQVLISTTPTIIQQPQQQQQVAQQQAVQQKQVVQQQQTLQQQNVVQQQQEMIQQPQQQPLYVQPSTVQLPQQILQSPPIKHDNILDNVKLPTEPLPPPQLANMTEPVQQTLPQTPVKPAVQITAQLVQTPQGPRIILQGIQGANLPKEYLLNIQQQVKTQLLKAQAEAKQQNKVPPTKILISLPDDIQAKLESELNKAAVTSPPQQVTLPTQPLAPAPALSGPPSTGPPAQVMNSIRTPRPLAPQIPTSIGSPRPVVLQQILQSNPGQRFMLIGPGGAKMAMVGSSASQQMTSPMNNVTHLLPNTPHPPSAVLSTAASHQNTTTVATSNAQVAATTMLSPSSAGNLNENSDKFELTPDYIQKAISDALKSQNLSPEIEQKLLALQHHTIEKGVVTSVTGKKGVAQIIDPLSGEPMDDEWEPNSRPRSSNAGRKKKSQVATEAGEPHHQQQQQQQQQQPQNNLISPIAAPPPATLSRAPATPPRSRTKSGQKSGPLNQINSGSAAQSAILEEKKRQQALSKLNAILCRHKEQLKKDIARKRAQQEKDLQIEIHREIEKAKHEHQMSSASNAGLGYGQLVANSYEVVSAASNNDMTSHQKRKRRDSVKNHNDIGANTSLLAHNSPPKKKKRTSSSSHAIASGLVKKNTVYCVCKTKYDPTKFYVGCDVCNNWFHGSCIGISEANAKNLSEYVCEECKKARENQEIYCLCKQPYDESQFYIGCERCTDWFHGHCVGILQVEADSIDEYLCPRCDPNSAMNRPNAKPLKQKEYELVKKVVKQLLVNRYSWHFKEPVNPSDVPNYYKVVKVPMDLQTIEDRVNQQYYSKLSEFVGDVMRIFENCRFFNQPNSAILKSAIALEAFFAQKLSALRQKIAET